MSSIFQDLRYALRLFRRKAGFTLIAVLTLGLGIGTTTAVFSVVNALLLRPLPYKEAHRLAMIQNSAAAADYRAVYSYPVFSDLREQSRSFQDLSAFSWTRMTVDAGEGPETVFGMAVTSNFFGLLGTSPSLGRGFLSGEDEPGKPKIAILSHGLWQRRFGGDPGIIGQTITTDKDTIEVVGVMPPSVKFDLIPESPRVEFWTPLGPTPGQMSSAGLSWLRIIGRLQPGVDIEQAQTELDVIGRRIKESGFSSQFTGKVSATFALSAISLGKFHIGDAGKPLLTLFGAVAFVLLIACVNVANLLLAHSIGRQKEIAIRAALGAARRRLIGQMLTESVTLSVAGGLLGLVFVSWSLKLITSLVPRSMTRMQEITIDRDVFFFAMIAALLTGVLFGLLPSWYGSKPDLQSVLKTGSLGKGSGMGGFRNSLVLIEVALAVVLLVGAGLMMNSFIRLTSVDPGFDADNLLTLHISMPPRRTAPERVAFVQGVMDQVRGLPGVKEAAIIDSLPIADGGRSQRDTRGALLEGPIAGDPDSEINLQWHQTTPEYFQTMGIKLLRGRLLAESDNEQAQPVVVVSERTAREAWPNEDPIGKRMIWTFVKGQRPTVVGVVSDVRHYNLNQEPTSLLYVPFRQSSDYSVHLAVRATADPLSLTPAVRSTIISLDRQAVIDNIALMETRLSDLVAQPRFYTVLLGWFGLMGTVLSAVGLYGVITYLVNQRSREVGIRIALGAQSRDILTLVVGHGLRLTMIGLGLGLVGAYAASRVITSLLFGITASDPTTYVVVTLVLLAVSALAYYVPARRATRVDPMMALRNE